MVSALLLALLFLATPRPAQAAEFLDGRLQVHGFGETILRVLSNNLNDDYDLSQMQFLFNLELEFDIAPDGWGPFSALSAYSRIEVRYDCIWRDACWLSDNIDHVGNGIRKLPHYKSNGRKSPYRGTALADPRYGPEGRRRQHDGKVALLKDESPFDRIFESWGPDQVLGTDDDNGPLIFGDLQYYRLSFRKVPGSLNGQNAQILSPLRPRDEVGSAVGRFADVNHPFSPLEGSGPCLATSVVVPQGCRYGYHIAKPPSGTAATPAGLYPNPAGIPIDSKIGELAFNPEDLKYYRMNPFRTAKDASKGLVPNTEAAGLYYPSAGLRRFLTNNRGTNEFDQDFRETSLAWNHGASQRPERELKEFYVDMESFDGQLWIRLGMQNIIWGKTELFRSQDQFNPQDLGLATLPNLEESRIALWAARAVWAFYDVGPLSDVRLELAAVLDQFEPTDFGRCGEPYSPLPVFQKCFGAIVHSVSGVGLAGEVRPPNWWNDIRGLEFGGRVEFRWRQFSFAFTDFYGYDDFPTGDVIYAYSRNVDPDTGRPRWGETGLRCDPERGEDDGCLGTPVLFDPYPKDAIERISVGGITTAPGFPNFQSNSPNFFDEDAFNDRIFRNRKRTNRTSVLKDIQGNHHANQTLYSLACAGTVGFTDLIPDVVTECGFNIFGSSRILETGLTTPFDQVPVVAGLSAIFGGSPVLYDAAIGVLSPAAVGLLTVVPLNHNDMGKRRCAGSPGDPATVFQANCFFTDWDIRSRTGEGYGALWGGQTGDGPGTNVNNIFGLPTAFGSLSSAFTPEQQALLGCGAYYASSCDRQGMDLLNAEASALFQSWPGFDGTPLAGYVMTDKSQPAPGTLGFEGGPVCTRYERGKSFILPGCRGPGDSGYDPRIDGSPYFSEYLNNTKGGNPSVGSFSDLRAFNDFAVKNGCPAILTPAGGVGPMAGPGRLKSEHIRMFNPFNCQAFKSEMAAFSYNFLAVAVLFSTDRFDDGFSKPEDFDEFDPARAFDPKRCSVAAPQFCRVVRDLLNVTGVGRNDIRAGGSYSYGRRDFTWHGGQEVAIEYRKRNILGFATDFAEDRSKSNWSIEATWFNRVPFVDRDQEDGLTDSSVYNLTISVDRPTFVNFLNANRTILFNSQWFIRYIPNHSRGFNVNGPVNVLMTFTAITGYFQDRMNTTFTFVYDFRSSSGAALPSLTYRFSANFSATFGLAFFFGDYQDRAPFLSPTVLGNRVGKDSNTDFVENGLTVVRDRDEAFLRLRYTF